MTSQSEVPNPLHAFDDEVDRLLETVRVVGYLDVVFDLDGTLTLLEMPWSDWIDAIALKLDPQARSPLRQVMRTPGAAWGAALNRHLSEGSISHQTVIEVSSRFESAYEKHRPNGRLLQALPTLKERGCSLRLWTSNTRATADRVLSELRVQDLFCGIVAREDVVLGKPDAEGWRSLGLTTDRSKQLLVGDSQNDQLAAHAAGVDYFEIRFFKTGSN